MSIKKPEELSPEKPVGMSLPFRRSKRASFPISKRHSENKSDEEKNGAIHSVEMEGKNEGMLKGLGSFKISNMSIKRRSETEEPSPEKPVGFSLPFRRSKRFSLPNSRSPSKYKEDEEKGGTNHCEEFENKVEVKKQNILKSVSKSMKKHSEPEEPSPEEDSPIRESYRSSPPNIRSPNESQDYVDKNGELENNVEEKNQGLLKNFGNFRMSKKNIKTLKETEEPSPEKFESAAGLSLLFRASKKVLTRQSPVEEPDTPDRKEGSGPLGIRRSKIYNNKKNEHIEEKGSAEKKESPGMATSLVNKLRSSMKARKRIDFNEEENKSKLGEALEEHEVEEEIEEILSVMEINELIHTRQLHKAFHNIALREQKLIDEMNVKNYHENVTDFTVRARDVDLLYESLFNTIRSIIKETLHQDPVDEDLVASMVKVIESEAIIHPNTTVSHGSLGVVLGQPRRWKHLWKEAVKDSVARRLECMPLNPGEQGWIGAHLKSLILNTLQDLTKVKNTLMGLYPEDYDVCSTYLQSFHNALATHIQKNVASQDLNCSQLYCLLDWIMNKYKSAEFMGNPELQPEISSTSLPPLLERGCLEKLEQDYRTALQEQIKSYMRNLLQMEKEKWERGEELEEETLKETTLLPLYIDIEHIIGTHVRESAKLSEELEKATFQIGIEELGSFSTRLQDTFSEWSHDNFTPISVQYLIYYINSLQKLRHNTAQADGEHCSTASAALNSAMEHFKQLLFHLFTRDTKPQFQKLITKSWLKDSTSFSAIMKSVEVLCRCIKHLIGPHNEEMARRVHKYLVKEYVTQIMKRKLSLSALKRAKGAQRMKEEGNLFSRVAEEMGSDHDRLCQVIPCISDMIGARKRDMKPMVEELYQLYPDISEEHIECILHLHGTGRSKKLLQHFHHLQKSRHPQKEPEEKLFSEIECPIQVACIPVSL